MPAAFDKPVICPRQIGRAAELDALLQVAADVAASAGQTILVAGEAGIGKSRLVREFGIRLLGDGWVCLEGTCFERDRLLPYAPFLEVLHASLATLSPAEVERCLGPSLAELARLLPELGWQPAQPAIDPEQEKYRICRALAGVVARISAGKPLLLVIDDLHWADDSSLQLVAVLAREIPRHRILLLGTYREDDVGGSLGYLLNELDRSRAEITLRLTRLGRDDVAAMLTAMFGRDQPLRPDFIRAIHDLSEGNPFFVEELVRSALAAGDVDPDGNRAQASVSELRLPRDIQDAVRRRSDLVSPAARQVLLLASVAGRRFEFDLLKRLSGRDEPELLELIKELIRAQLVVEVETGRDHFAFRHALTRQAVYGQLLGRERREFHRRVGQAIEQVAESSGGSGLEDLAYHFLEAGDWPRAVTYGERAGGRADALGAPASAVEQYARAIEAARRQPIPVPSRLYRARGMAYERLGDFEPARADYECALISARTEGDRVSECRGLLDLGFLWAGRDYERTRAYFDAALDLARTLDDARALALSLNRVGNWHVNVEQPAAGERLHREALALFERLDDSLGVAETLDLLGLAEYMQGNLLHAVHYLDRAISLFRDFDARAGLTSALAHRAVSVTTYHSCTAPTLPRFADEAEAMVTEAKQLARALGWRASEAFASMVLASVLGPRGAYARALAEARAALHIAEEIGHRQWICASRYVLGEIYRDVLALEHAGRELGTALDLARELGSGNWSTVATGSLVATFLAGGAVQSAVALLEDPLTGSQRPETMGQRQLRLAAAEMALRQSEPLRALQLLECLRGTTRTAPAVELVRARALRAVGQVDEARTALLAAIELATSCGLMSILWRLHAEHAAVLDSLGRGQDAATARSDAVAIVEKLADGLTDVQLGQSFVAAARRAVGIAAPSRKVRRGPGDLTARELDVARLIALGKSNHAIASSLVLSERTVEDHVSRMLKKLGFRSRAEIAVWATQAGLLTAGPAEHEPTRHSSGRS